MSRLKKTKVIHKSSGSSSKSGAANPHQCSSSNTSKGHCMHKLSGNSSKCSSQCSRDDDEHQLVGAFVYVTPDKKAQASRPFKHGALCSKMKNNKLQKLRGEHSSLNKTVCTPGNHAGSSVSKGVATSVKSPDTPLFSSFKDFQHD